VGFFMRIVLQMRTHFEAAGTANESALDIEVI
jgi:hypothetical protein